MLNLLKRIFSLPKAFCSQSTENLKCLENIMPACALLSKHGLQTQTAYGDTPVTLSEDVCVQWHLTAPSHPITGIKLRIGTYGRRNACHLVVQLQKTQAQIALAHCLDNEYAEIKFTSPVICKPQQILSVRVFSPDALLAEDNVVALWCSRPVPQFYPDQPITPLYFAPTEYIQFSVLCHAHADEKQLYQSLRSLLECEPHANKELLLYGAKQKLPWLTGAVHYLDTLEDMQPQGEFMLWLTQSALWTEGSLQALRDTLQQTPAQLVMPKVLDEQGHLCSAGGQVFSDARFYQYPVNADATHPEYNQSRQILSAQPPCVLMKASLRHNAFSDVPYNMYQSAAYTLLHVSLSVPLVFYCPTASVVVADWQNDLSETDRQDCWQHWQAVLQNQPLPFLSMPESPCLHCPDTKQPLLSIVIPIFNQVDHTWHCLQSLLQCDPDISREIIIIDNASTDRTAALLAGLSGAFKIIRNEENVGFVDACNQGAAQAQGRYILLLNNDTQVRPGCLQNMVEVLENHTDVGIVGAKLLYPDGRLQEAGCQLFPDGSATNVGRAGDAQANFAQHDRDVDYCSGAALMIRRTLWQQLKGFDQRYAPAYYEDTDLCMQARQAGFKVRYCHMAEVIHYEGVTAGVDVNTGYKAYQTRNQQLFYNKWQDVLEKS